MAKKETPVRIDHAVFGLGTVIEANERYTTIAFDEAGTRKFLTSMVELSPSDTPKPARPRRKKAVAKKKKKKVAKSAAKKSDADGG